MAGTRSKKEAQKYYEDNKEDILLTIRKYKLKSQYGLTVEDYDKMLEKQNGVCAICKQEETYITYRSRKSGRMTLSRLCIDHNHNTGQIRGLLCRRCNHGLGSFEDSVELFKNAIAYLRKDKKK